ncbi:MAG: Gfo/Idh/MocA family oxidoreductase [Acidobacteriaceae bacterium]
MPPLRVAVIGAGAFGRNHLRVYRELELAHPGLVQLAALVEPVPERRALFASTYSIPTFATLTELLSANLSLDAASICVPTIHHTAVAEQLLLAELDILIEKPFAATLEQADHILALALTTQRIVAIGHLERFNPAVTATLQALNQPMFFESHRLSIFTPRSLDVDVVLDLMIHDLDIVLTFAHSPIREVRAVGLPILSRKTDIANVRVEFESGCVANFTASRVSTEQVRKLRLFQPHQYLSLDFARQELLTISVDPAIIAAAAAAGSSPFPAAASHAPTAAPSAPSPSGPGEHPTAGLSLTKPDIPKGEPLRLELEDFLHAVRNRTQPRVPAEAGRAALALALTINDQIASHAHRAGLL